MNIFCKNWDAVITVAAFYLCNEIYEKLSWAINPDIYFLIKWPTDSWLIVNTYLVKESDL